MSLGAKQFTSNSAPLGYSLGRTVARSRGSVIPRLASQKPAAPLFVRSSTNPTFFQPARGATLVSTSVPSVAVVDKAAAPALKPGDVLAKKPLQVGETTPSAQIAQKSIRGVWATVANFFKSIRDSLAAMVGFKFKNVVHGAASSLSKVATDLTKTASDGWQAAQQAETQALRVASNNLAKAKATVTEALSGGQTSAAPQAA